MPNLHCLCEGSKVHVDSDDADEIASFAVKDRLGHSQ
eukprot:gene21242-8036_t